MRRLTAIDRKVYALGKAVSLSALNQVISSGTNLLLSIYLAKALTPAEFGLYGIGFSAALLLSGMGNALILTQMAVHFPEKGEGERAQYAARMLWLVMGLCALVLALMLPTRLILESTGVGVGSDFLLAAALSSVSYLLKDYFVRLSYSLRSETSAIIVSSFVALGTLGGGVLAALLDARLSAVTALLTFSFGQLLGAGAGAFRAALPMLKCDARHVLIDVRQAWLGGRWAVGGALVIWLQSQAYIYVTAATVGAAGVGYANVARLFVSPFQAILPAVGQVMLPRLASMRATGVAGISHLARRYLIAMTALVGVYLTILAIAYRFLVSALGPQYASLGALVGLWGFVLIAQVLRDSASTTMQALRMFREIMTRNIWSALVVVVSALLLSTQFGAAGSILSVALGEAVLAILLWRHLVGINRASGIDRRGA